MKPDPNEVAAASRCVKKHFHAGFWTATQPELFAQIACLTSDKQVIDNQIEQADELFDGRTGAEQLKQEVGTSGVGRAGPTCVMLTQFRGQVAAPLKELKRECIE